MTKDLKDEYKEFLKPKKPSISEDRNIMAELLVQDHCRDSLNHVLAGSPLEEAVKREMKKRGYLNVEGRKKK